MKGMAAVYALESFHWNNGGGETEFVNKGARRDSVTSPVAVAEPQKFTAALPVANNATITGILAQYLVTYPNGPQL